jgi:hypothetical protein
MAAQGDLVLVETNARSGRVYLDPCRVPSVNLRRPTSMVLIAIATGDAAPKVSITPIPRQVTRSPPIASRPADIFRHDLDFSAGAHSVRADLQPGLEPLYLAQRPFQWHTRHHYRVPLSRSVSAGENHHTFLLPHSEVVLIPPEPPLERVVEAVKGGVVEVVVEGDERVVGAQNQWQEDPMGDLDVGGAGAYIGIHPVLHSQGDSVHARGGVGVRDRVGVGDGERRRAIAEVPGGGEHVATSQVGEGDGGAGAAHGGAGGKVGGDRLLPHLPAVGPVGRADVEAVVEEQSLPLFIVSRQGHCYCLPDQPSTNLLPGCSIRCAPDLQPL